MPETATRAIVRYEARERDESPGCWDVLRTWTDDAQDIDPDARRMKAADARLYARNSNEYLAQMKRKKGKRR